MNNPMRLLIHCQPCVRPRIDEALGQISHLVILAAGTSHYAGQVGRYWFEQLAGLPVTVEVASEYRYRHPAHVPDGAALAISQSGESPDTLGLRQI